MRAGVIVQLNADRDFRPPPQGSSLELEGSSQISVAHDLKAPPKNILHDLLTLCILKCDFNNNCIFDVTNILFKNKMSLYFSSTISNRNKTYLAGRT